METNVLRVLLPIMIIICEMTALISWIVERKTRNPITKKQRKINKISKVIFRNFLPAFVIEAIPIFIIIGFITWISGIFDVYFNSSSSSYLDSGYSNTKFNESMKNVENGEKRYYHYNDNKTTSICGQTAIRSDGVGGYKRGDFIYYNDGSIGHVLDEADVIEEWQ